MDEITDDHQIIREVMLDLVASKTPPLIEIDTITSPSGYYGEYDHDNKRVILYEQAHQGRPRSLLETGLHELAHHVAPKGQSHGSAWRAALNRLCHAFNLRHARRLSGVMVVFPKVSNISSPTFIRMTGGQLLAIVQELEADEAFQRRRASEFLDRLIPDRIPENF